VDDREGHRQGHGQCDDKGNHARILVASTLGGHV
jgi:hypothetical protein